MEDNEITYEELCGLLADKIADRPKPYVAFIAPQNCDECNDTPNKTCWEKYNCLIWFALKFEAKQGRKNLP